MAAEDGPRFSGRSVRQRRTQLDPIATRVPVVALITRRSEARELPPPPLNRWSARLVHRHRRLSSVFAFDRIREGGISRGLFLGSAHLCVLCPMHGGTARAASTLRFAPSRRPDRCCIGLHWACRRAPTPINRAGRSVRCDLDTGGDDDGQVSGSAVAPMAVRACIHRPASPALQRVRASRRSGVPTSDRRRYTSLTTIPLTTRSTIISRTLSSKDSFVRSIRR